MLVDTVYAESVEHVERSHPLRVTLCKVVVDSDYVYTVAGECVKEHRECRNQCLTLTCCHLGNLTLVEYGTTEQLYVIVYHVPYSVVATCLPVVLVYGLIAVDCDEIELGRKVAVKVVRCHDYGLVLSETACAVLHDGESLGQCLVKCLVKHLQHLLLQFVNLVEDALSLLEFCILDACLENGNLLAQWCSATLYLLLECCGCCTQLIIAQCGDLWIDGLHLLYPWLYLAHVSACLVAE